MYKIYGVSLSTLQRLEQKAQYPTLAKQNEVIELEKLKQETKNNIYLFLRESLWRINTKDKDERFNK